MFLDIIKKILISYVVIYPLITQDLVYASILCVLYLTIFSFMYTSDMYIFFFNLMINYQ